MKILKNLAVSIFLFCLLSTISIAQTNWGAWRTTSCWKGLDYRVRNDGYNKYVGKYKWSIQFRNRYRQRIGFMAIAIRPGESSPKTDKYINVSASDTSSAYWFVDSKTSILMYFEHMSIGKRKFRAEEYYRCDNR